MFKKRPRRRAGRISLPAADPPASKMEAAYWRGHLFKNTYTYRGRQREVRAWSVKIQLFGKRKTFSLHSSDPSKAASEACRLYQTIYSMGWDAVQGSQARRDHGSYLLTLIGETAPSGDSANREQWKRRLIYRPYPPPESPDAERELCVRIEHLRTARYFPLGTNHEDKAVRRAMQIHRTLLQQGWEIACEQYPRELTVAMRWLDDPLAWTYTTFHTWTHGSPVPIFAASPGGTSACNVAIVEPDAGIRFALATCVNSQPGFRCCAAYAEGTEASREIVRRKTDLVLVNHSLPDRSGTTVLQELRKLKSGIIGLCFSVFEDSDELFKSTPGGATGYLLKRTSANQLFSPIADPPGALTEEFVALRLREYFEQIVTALSTGLSEVDEARLTPREQEVLALLAKGYLAKTIASTLGISIWTVHGHVKNIFEKLHVHSRTEAVVKYLQK